MVAEAGLELKEEQNSRNERQKHATQKICQERLWRQPPKPCLCELHCFRSTYGYILIMTLDTSLRPRHQVDQAEKEDMLPCCSCKAVAHMCFANCIGRAVRKHNLLKKSQRTLWKRCSGTLHGNLGSCRCPQGPAKQWLPSHCSGSTGTSGLGRELQRAVVLPPMSQDTCV